MDEIGYFKNVRTLFEETELQAEYVKMRAMRRDKLKAYVVQNGIPPEDLVGYHDVTGILQLYMARKYGDFWGSKI